MIPLILIDAKTDRCAAIGQYLAGTGAYRVMASASSEVTLSRNLIESPAVVLAVHEEGENGLLFLQKLREREIDLPVIILAAEYNMDFFRDAVANRAEYLVMAGPQTAGTRCSCA